MESLKEKVHRLTVQRFGKTIQLFAPLYLSNECVDTCLYCGFSRHNKIERKTLSVTEVLEEAKILINQGFKHLLLVSGEHPKKVSVDYLSEIARTLRPKIASLSIEVAPLDEQSYQRLALYGVDGVVIYQETYDKEACKAGIRQVGIGVLLGLSPWQKEIQRLIEHAKYLMKRYWQTEFRISLPRLKPCASSFQAPYPVSDEEFAHIIMMLRVALPELGLVLSTREKPELRDQLIYLGVTHMSAGSKTEPGGYAHPEEAGKQFDIEDLRTPAEVARAITKAGYEPVWKDWI